MAHDLVERFDHIGLAVHDLRQALPLVELIGGQYIGGGISRRQQFRWIQFALPGLGKIELLEATATDSFLQRFLERRGEGMHHLTFKVRDVSEAAARAERLGFRTTGLRTANPEWREVFVHPSSAHGVLIQLAEWPDDLPIPTPTLEELLAEKSI